MALKVIGAGFGRTGTASLKAALEQIGFNPCYHMQELFAHPEHVRLWQAATEGRSVPWDSIFGGYQATVDWPGCSFYKELMAAYPDAKVLLNVRDPEAWYKSAHDTIYGMSQMGFPGSLVPLFVPRLRRFVRMANRLIWQQTFDDRFADKAYALEVLERHIEEVKRTVPADRLLVYEVKEGWEPLCAFLDVPVPDQPFPRLNDSAAFRKRTNLLRFGRRGAQQKAQGGA